MPIVTTQRGRPGALILHAPAGLNGAEIEISPDGTPAATITGGSITSCQWAG